MTISLANGLFIGVIYGLFAVGIVLVYRSDRIINFAHGNLGMIGTFFYAKLWNDSGWPMALALVVGIAISASLGVATERLVARPLRGHRPEIATLATFGMSTLFFVWASRRWGTRPILNKPFIKGTAFEFAGVRVQHLQLITLGVALLILVILVLILRRTNFGLRVRATALNAIAAAEAGVRTERVSMAVWALAGAIAAAAGILVSARGVLDTQFMGSFMLRGLAVAIVGGLTNVGGAFIAGIAVGVAEGYIGYQFSAPGSQEAILALFVVVVLMVRPTGLVKAEY
jgi:branched-subunit amino acid ABC-type transport system permease component